MVPDSDGNAAGRQRRPRADARRNRERLLAAARDAFTPTGDAAPAEAEVSLEAIARAAGVGIGTLYRNFPTRQDLIAALYHRELDDVVAAAEPLLAAGPADRALRAWADRYAAFVATKHGMAEALQHVLTTGAVDRDDTRSRLRAVVARFLAAGVADGTLRDDVQADDVVVTLLGVLLATRATADPDQIGRALDLVLDGLRTR